MKTTISCFTLLLFIALTLSLSLACGGGDAATSSVTTVTETGTVVVSGVATDTLSTGTLSGAFYTANPGEPANSTKVNLQVDPTHSLTVIFTGKTTGDYSIANGEAMLSYTAANSQTYAASNSLSGTSGAVSVSQYGAVGEAIVGTFDVSADVYIGSSASGTTTNLTGSFTVIREVDNAQ